MSMHPEAMEKAGVIAGKTLMYGGAAGSAVSGLTLSDIGVMVGIVIGVLGLLLGQYWAWRKDRRERRESDTRLQREQREMEARMRHKFGTGWDEL